MYYHSYITYMRQSSYVLSLSYHLHETVQLSIIIAISLTGDQLSFTAVIVTTDTRQYS